MKKIWKKLLAVTLAASMTMSMVTLGAMADEDPTGQTQTTGTVTTTNEDPSTSPSADPSTNPSTEPSTEPSASQDPATHEHVWDGGKVTTEPICTEPGVKTHYCTAEGCKATTTSTIPAKGHTWGSAVVTKQPTETEEGEKTYTCTDCGATKTEAIAVLPSVPAVATVNGVGYPTLQDAINAAQSGDTIVLVQDFTATDENPSNDWLNMVTASKTPVLTIDLNGHTVDCGNQFGWLSVNGKMNLTVKNGTIQNAGNCSQGSAIWAFGTLTLEDMTIQDCTCTSFGGAVFVGGSHGDANLTVKNCMFTGNSARDGGAIWFAEGHKADISNTTFTNNVAQSIGGAVYVNGSWEDETAVVTLYSCTFEGNKALAGGAVASYDNCNLTVTGCMFTDNHANEGNGSGGAIYATGNQAANMPGTLTVNSNTTFTGNTAAYGGAVFAYYLYPSKLENVTFTRNNATGAYGGAVYCYNAGGLTVDHVEATSNTSGNCGGAFFLNHAPATITNSTITYNTAAYGGGLYLSQSATTISNSTITDNTAAYGGGITNYFDKLTLAEGAKVHNNVAGNMGDDIYSSDAGYHDSYPASLELGEAASVELKSDNKTITGWFIDGQEGETTVTNRWSAEGFYKKFNGENSVVALKAAHDAYYTVTYTDGVEDVELFDDQTANVLAGTATPAFEGTPTRSGYTFTGWDPEVAETVTGNATYTAQWQENTFTVTWLDGYNETAVKSAKYGVVTELEKYHNEYPADPSRGGYTFTGWSDPVVDDNGNITITAQWSLNSTPTTYYSLTINYVDGEGNVVADRYTTRQASGYRYSVNSPAVAGMTPDQATVSGILTGNTTLTVTYSEDLDEPDTPTTESPEPTESPEVTETPAPTESPEESEDLNENDTPLVETPETSEPPVEPTETPDEGEDLGDNDTPLAEVPQTGDMLWLWMTLAAGSAVSLAWISAEEKKGKRVSK